MPSDRFFTSQPFTFNQELRLSGEEHHHMVNVMRLSPNTPLELINGKGDLAEAVLLHTGKKEAILSITKTTHFPRAPYSLRLAIGLPRFNRLEYILEKATELGIDTFILFPASGSEKTTLSDNQWDRISHLLIASIKQCGRLYLPEVNLIPSLDSWMFSQEKSFFGDTKLSAPPFIQKIESHNSTTVFIGPEKGWTPEEIAFLENTLHSEGVKLCSHTLRVDTAAIAAAAQLASIN